MKIKIIASIVVCCMFSMILVNASAGPLKMVINENIVINTTRPEMYGYNVSFGDGIGNIFYDDDGSDRESFYTNMAGYPFTNNRLAGTESNYIQWKNALGPLTQREPYIYALNKDKLATKPILKKIGIAEIYKPILKIYPDAKFTYVVNHLWDDMQNVADVVEYLRSDGTVNYNGGVNWGIERKKDGIENPVEIIAWELGNEVDLAPSNSATIEQQIAASRAAISAIKSVDSDAKIAIHTATNDTSSVVNDWHRMLLKEFSNDIDFIVIHKYYTHRGVTRVLENFFAQVEQDILNLTGSDRIKILVTEHASGYLGDHAKRLETWPKNSSMSGVLNEGDFFNRLWQYSSFYAANYHCFSYTGPWSICYIDKDGKVIPNAIAKFYKLLSENAVGDVVESKLDGFQLLKVSNVTGAAIKTTESLNVFLVNYNTDKSVDLEFEFSENEYRLISKTIFTGDTIYANQWQNIQDMTITTEKVGSEHAFKKYELPPIAYVMLKLESIQK